MEYISPEGLRQDGRRAQELRQLRCELGLLPRADGSATFEMGNTKVLACVIGPQPGRSQPSLQARGQIACDVAFATFCSGERRRRSRRDRRARDAALVVQATLEQTILLDILQRSEIKVYLQVLQADGGERAACINAAVLAVVNAGIPVRDLVAACETGYLDATPLIDLNLTEIGGRGPQATLALSSNLGKIAFLEVGGSPLRQDALGDVCALAQEGAKAVAQFMRRCLLGHGERIVKCQGVTTY